MGDYQEIKKKVREALIRASSSFSPDKIAAYEKAIGNEKNERSKWAMEAILENASIACKNESPLCDDTGIPHLVLDVGTNRLVTGDMLEIIMEGVQEGLRKLPGRPMAVLGDDWQRLDQSMGLDEDSGAVEIAPIMLRKMQDNILRLHIMMLGGGPAIRAKTYRVFHRHDKTVIMDEVVSWAKESVSLLGCSPCTLAVGIGRSHYEASAMMLQALMDGRYDRQNEMEQRITDQVNQSHIGALGLGGSTSVLATFLRVGPQRASGVRIVCMRPCCCFEPRVASVDL